MPAMRDNRKTYSGNRILVEFGGTVVGLIQSCRLSDNYGLEDASGVGDIHVVEHVPSKAVHQLSVQNMVLFVGNMRDAGVSRINGDDAMQGLIFDFSVYRKDTGALLRQYIGCSYDSGDVDITAHRITMQSSQFKCIDVTGTGL